MALTLSVLICLSTIGILAGRVYEILNLTDMETGLLLTDGIVMNPLFLLVFTVIVLCCGIIVFGKDNKPERFFSASSKMIAIPAGVAFAVSGIISVNVSGTAVFMIAGGAALIIMGITGLGDTIKDALVIVLFTVFSLGMCLDVIFFDVFSIYNAAFMHRVLAYSSIVLFIYAVLKNVYAPTGFSGMLLYISGFLCFSFSGMLSIAELICCFVSGNLISGAAVKNVAMVLFGIYALDNALSVLPDNVVEEQENDGTEDVEQKIYETEKSEIELSAALDVKKDSSEEEIKRMLYSDDTESKNYKSENKSDRKLFKAGKVETAVKEKIVYKKPKR